MKHTVSIKDVYVNETATIVGPYEKKGPLSEYFDRCYDDLYFGEKTFEKAERKLAKEAIDTVLKKSRYSESEIGVIIAGDLSNQITNSSYTIRNYNIPYIGTFGACSNASLTTALAAMHVHANLAPTAIALTSSHYATAERQFRFPVEYGGQRPQTSTTTVTGAGAIIISKKPSPIKIDSVTIGVIKDGNLKNPNDMGTPMALAAYDTIKQHLNDLERSLDYYDLVVTGDLSSVGSKVLVDLLKEDNIKLKDNYRDCGLLIYDINEQKNVFSGGSGCACCAVVTYGYLLTKLKEGVYKRILMVATGALLSPTVIQQKETIPCIAHAVAFEGGGV